jgi:hypothetical protein
MVEWREGRFEARANEAIPSSIWRLLRPRFAAPRNDIPPGRLSTA